MVGVGNIICNEIYSALCKKDRRYRAEVKELWSNCRLLVAAIAGYIAAQVGLATAIVSALTAVTLRLILLVGKNAFCEYWGQVTGVAKGPTSEGGDK